MSVCHSSRLVSSVGRTTGRCTCATSSCTSTPPPCCRRRGSATRPRVQVASPSQCCLLAHLNPGPGPGPEPKPGPCRRPRWGAKDSAGRLPDEHTPAVAVHALLPRHVQPLTSNIRQEQEPLTAEPQKASTHTQQQTSRHRHRVQVHMITHQTTATNRYDVWAGRVG